MCAKPYLPDTQKRITTEKQKQDRQKNKLCFSISLAPSRQNTHTRHIHQVYDDVISTLIILDIHKSVDAWVYSKQLFLLCTHIVNMCTISVRYFTTFKLHIAVLPLHLLPPPRALFLLLPIIHNFPISNFYIFFHLARLLHSIQIPTAAQTHHTQVDSLKHKFFVLSRFSRWNKQKMGWEKAVWLTSWYYMKIGKIYTKSAHTPTTQYTGQKIVEKQRKVAKSM